MPKTSISNKKSTCCRNFQESFAINISLSNTECLSHFPPCTILSFKFCIEVSHKYYRTSFCCSCRFLRILVTRLYTTLPNLFRALKLRLACIRFYYGFYNLESAKKIRYGAYFRALGSSKYRPQKNPTEGDRHSCFISRNIFVIFRDPANQSGSNISPYHGLFVFTY